MKLSEMTPRNVHNWQQFALVRLQLRFTAETQKMYSEFGDWLHGVVLLSADADGYADEIALFSALSAINNRWRKLQADWICGLCHLRQ